MRLKTIWAASMLTALLSAGCGGPAARDVSAVEGSQADPAAPSPANATPTLSSPDLSTPEGAWGSADSPDGTSVFYRTLDNRVFLDLECVTLPGFLRIDSEWISAKDWAEGDVATLSLGTTTYSGVAFELGSGEQGTIGAQFLLTKELVDLLASADTVGLTYKQQSAAARTDPQLAYLVPSCTDYFEGRGGGADGDVGDEDGETE